MDNAVNWIVVGRFGRVHGIKGFITIHSYTEPRDNILRYTQWHALMGNHWQPLKLSRVEVNDKHILVQVEGFDEREQVASLTNIEIGVNREQLPELAAGEFYWHQLVGMQVVNQQGDALGEVVEILPTGSNDVLVVEGKKRQLIPYLPGRSVIDVNLSQRCITVDWDADF
ncbi:MAG: ribosome maturation factor RimM [Legionella sp.]|nr:ribosome maturation factor RimM [Legionella sp.]